MIKEKIIHQKYYLSILSLGANIFLIVLIFRFSLTPADISSQESESVMNIFNIIFPFNFSDHMVRKLAHFTEFASLGVISALTVFSFCRKPFKGIFAELFLCLAVGVTDEFIQLDVPGRSGQVGDIILDFSGSVTGIAAATLIIFIIYKLYVRKKSLKMQKASF